MHFDQLLCMRGPAHEEEYPFCAPVEREGLSLLDDDRLFINGLEHLIRSHAPILHARLTPAYRRDGRSRHYARHFVAFFNSHVLFLRCDRCVGGKHCFVGVHRHDEASSLIDKTNVLRFC